MYLNRRVFVMFILNFSENIGLREIFNTYLKQNLRKVAVNGYRLRCTCTDWLFNKVRNFAIYRGRKWAWGDNTHIFYANELLKMQTFSSKKFEYMSHPIFYTQLIFFIIYLCQKAGIRVFQTQKDNENWQNCSEWLSSACVGPYHQNKVLLASEILWIIEGFMCLLSITSTITSYYRLWKFV